MDRVAVTGNSCGGKSTFARRLAAELGLPYIELDSLLWQRDGTYLGDDAYLARHAELIARDRWVIDGLELLPSLWQRLDRADAIVLVDLPLWIHFLHAAERHSAWLSGSLEHPPGGLPVPPMPLGPQFKGIWDIDQQFMPQLRRACAQKARSGKTAVRLSSVPALDAFGGRNLSRLNNRAALAPQA
jgi:hypothetical protein